ncbi:NmrA family NAD(P)-binding protein [Streptomyces pseudoechinosporeus]
MECETPRTTTLPVLVVGATGSLGGKVVDELLKRGKNVRALVRPTTDASRLEKRGVEIARGDMLDLDSLVAATQHARVTRMLQEFGAALRATAPGSLTVRTWTEHTASWRMAA